MQQIFDIYKDHPAASETVDRDNDHHPVLLEVGRFYGTDDLSEQTGDVHSVAGDQTVRRFVFNNRLRRNVRDVGIVSDPGIFDLFVLQ